MCYCDFGEILPHIAAMDADVISPEASRSRMELLEDFPPRIPSPEQMRKSSLF